VRSAANLYYAMPRWLYLWPLNFVIASFVIFGAIFLLLTKRSRGRTRTADSRSIIAIFVQGLAFAIAWTIGRKPFTPFLPIDWHAQYFVAAVIVLLVFASLIFVTAAVRALGQQWSLQARILEHHELVRRGPYRIVRHPIYTGMFGMLVVSSLARGHWLGLIVASIVYYLGTVLRIGSEEKLLREQFGREYETYARDVPAFIPIRFWSGNGS
jgi:protein-S-isoprenylcysteine O-methyltransferase Ste14